MKNLLEDYRLLEPLVLVLDPSVNCYGWVLVNNAGDISRYGVLKVDKTNDISIVSSIQKGLEDLFDTYTIIQVFIETPIGGQNAAATKALWMIYPIALMICNTLQIQFTAIKANVPKTTFGIKYKDEVLLWLEENGVKIKNELKPVRETVADCLLIYHFCITAGLVENTCDLINALEFVEMVIDESDEPF